MFCLAIKIVSPSTYAAFDGRDTTAIRFLEFYKKMRGVYTIARKNEKTTLKGDAKEINRGIFFQTADVFRKDYSSSR